MSRFAEHTQFLSALNFFVEKFNYVDTEINNCNCDGSEAKCKEIWFIRRRLLFVFDSIMLYFKRKHWQNSLDTTYLLVHFIIFS